MIETQNSLQNFKSAVGIKPEILIKKLGDLFFLHSYHQYGYQIMWSRWKDGYVEIVRNGPLQQSALLIGRYEIEQKIQVIDILCRRVDVCIHHWTGTGVPFTEPIYGTPNRLPEIMDVMRRYNGWDVLVGVLAV